MSSNLKLSVRNVSQYNEVIKNIDLERLLLKENDLPKLPKRKKLYRTLSLSRELRALGKDYFYFHDNAIAIEIIFDKLIRKKVVLIVATEHNYKVRVDQWAISGGGNFYYKEIEQPTGHALLWELVSLEILDPTYLPKISRHHEKLNDL